MLKTIALLSPLPPPMATLGVVPSFWLASSAPSFGINLAEPAKHAVNGPVKPQSPLSNQFSRRLRVCQGVTLPSIPNGMQDAT